MSNTIHITNQKEWDELPDGFEVFTVLKIMSNEMIIINGNKKNSSAELWGNSSAELWDNSFAVLYDKSSARLWDNSSAELWGNSSAELCDKSFAKLWGNSSAELCDKSFAKLWHNSSAKLYGDSSAVLHGNSSAELYNNSSAVLHDNSSAELRDKSFAKLWGDSSARLYGDSSAKLYGESSAKLYSNSSIVKAFDSSVIWRTHQEVGFIDSNVTLKELGILSSHETLLDHGVLRADGITKEILSTKKITNNITVYALEGGLFCANQGETFAHGDTIKQALADLRFKLSDRDKSFYEGRAISHKFTFEEAIECYRIITGACSSGVRDFIKSKSVSEEDKTIGEIIELTSDVYGGRDFKEFFT